MVRRCVSAGALTLGCDGRQVKEAKGLDMVRRDWCGLAKDCGNFALDQILSGQPCEEVVDAIHAKLQEVRQHCLDQRRERIPSSLLRLVAAGSV